jgi:hypothetical protein
LIALLTFGLCPLQNAIDLDQAEIATQASAKTEESFQLAKAVYEQGAHSKSYAKLKFDGAAPASISDGDRFVGSTEGNQAVYGKVYKSSKSPDGYIWLQYETSDSQSGYVNCQVGGLTGTSQNTEGCFKASGTIKLVDTSVDYAYSYDPTTENDNGRTIQGFSTAVETKMISGCPGW